MKLSDFSLKKLMELYFRYKRDFDKQDCYGHFEYFALDAMGNIQKEIDRRGCSYPQIQAAIEMLKDNVVIERIYESDGDIKGLLEYKPTPKPKGMTLKELKAKTYNIKGYQNDNKGYIKVSTEFISGGWFYYE